MFCGSLLSKKIMIVFFLILGMFLLTPIVVAQDEISSVELSKALDMDSNDSQALTYLDFSKSTTVFKDPFDNTFNGKKSGQYSYSLQHKKHNPILSYRSIINMKKAIKKYANIVDSGGWSKVKTSKKLQYGDKTDEIYNLRKRLIKTNDLSYLYEYSDVYDSFLKRAVQNFQMRHGIKPTGIVNKATRNALNVSAEKRLLQLKMNLLRVQRDVNRGLKSRYVLVNIPAAYIEAVDEGQVKSTHRAVVGMIDRKTPIVNSNISMVNFNPYWHIPKSIVIKDLIPIVKKDPTYLKRLGIRIYDGLGTELQYEEVDWHSERAKDFHYRQDPSRGNSLGAVKIHFYNRHAVFLHDTPSKVLFNRFFRAYSSGCVRVQNIRQLIYFLLEKNRGWSPKKIDVHLRNGQRVDVKLKKKIPIIITYITAWAYDDGSVYFRYDLYKRDGIKYAA